MFDIGFWELMLIGVMGLIILGPERLPVAIRTVRGWISGARKFSDTVKTELTEELRIHELHENLKKAEQGDMSNLSPEITASLKTLKEAAASVNEPFKKIDTTAMDSMVSDALAPHDLSGDALNGFKNAQAPEPSSSALTGNLSDNENSELTKANLVETTSESSVHEGSANETYDSLKSENKS